MESLALRLVVYCIELHLPCYCYYHEHVVVVRPAAVSPLRTPRRSQCLCNYSRDRWDFCCEVSQSATITLKFVSLPMREKNNFSQILALAIRRTSSLGYLKVSRRISPQVTGLEGETRAHYIRHLLYYLRAG